MDTKITKRYNSEFKEQIVKECQETNNYTLVARKNNIPSTTVYTWLNKDKNKLKIKASKKNRSLEKELADARLENKILKELLKKSHQLWLKE